MTAPPPSTEVLTEEFYDACAWLRDLNLAGAPEFHKLSLTVHYPIVARLLNPETDEITEEPAAIEIRIDRYESGAMHVTGPGVCASIDLAALREKRL